MTTAIVPPSEFDDLMDQLIENFASRRPVRANSLLVTLFGDSICPHGGIIWLGSLIKLVEPLGINQRLVRTSVFRLTQDGLLGSEQQGRRSYYSLTPKGLRQFSTASMRIYNNRKPGWDGYWRLVFTGLSDITQEERNTVRQELLWLGFARLAPGVFGHPTADLEPVKTLVSELGLQHKVAMMMADTVDDNMPTPSSALVKHCFEMESMDAAYDAFIEVFDPLLNAAKNERSLDNHKSFMLRTLLIHEFRRILLSEPELPFELIPENSSSHRAWLITQEIYKLVAAPAERYLVATSETADGPLPEAGTDFQTRFGGI